MIESSKLIEKEYRSVKLALSDKLNLAIANEEREVIFDPQSHTKIKGPKTISSFRKDLKEELKPLPQVKKVEINRLKNLYACTCHNDCSSINVNFRPQKLKCGETCAKTCFTPSCKKYDGPSSQWCRRKTIKQRRKIGYEAILIRITLDPDYSPPKKKSVMKKLDVITDTLKQEDSETSNDNLIVFS